MRPAPGCRKPPGIFPQEQEETFTLTKEQMEKMEGLAEQLAAQNDKYLRLAAEYDNYRGFSSSPGWDAARSRLS